jgi:hypothetical protein
MTTNDSSPTAAIWPRQAGFPDPGNWQPVFMGVCKAAAERDDQRMEKPTAALRKTRSPSDLFGAFCFVVLVLTVVYATLSID